MHTSMWWPEADAGNYPQSLFLSPYPLRQGPSNLEVTHMATLPSQLALKILQAGHRAQWALEWVSGIQTLVLTFTWQTFKPIPLWILTLFMREEPSSPNHLSYSSHL